MREMKTQAPVGLLAGMGAGLAERTRAHAQCSLQAGTTQCKLGSGNLRAGASGKALLLS